MSFSPPSMADLAGRRILVTRPSHQAGELAQGIRAAGGEPVLFPLLEIRPIADPAQLYAQLSELAHYQLLIFISPNAVAFGMAAIAAAGVNWRELSARFATVGQSSAQALRELGVSNVLVPHEQFDSEGLLALPALRAVADWRVLIVRGEGGRAVLGDTLAARGATVEYAECYQRSTPKSAEVNWQALDAIVVSSSEALAALRTFLTDAELSIPLFVLHPRIAALAQQQGWRHIYTTASGDAGLLTALQQWAEESECVSHD